jgi:hypothetical protein
MPKSPTKRIVKTKITKPRAKKPELAAAYKIIMRVGGETHIAYNDNPLEALLELKPDKIPAKAIFTLEHDGKSATLIRRAQWARLTLNRRAVAFYLARNLERLLK